MTFYLKVSQTIWIGVTPPPPKKTKKKQNVQCFISELIDQDQDGNNIKQSSPVYGFVCVCLSVPPPPRDGIK